MTDIDADEIPELESAYRDECLCENGGWRLWWNPYLHNFQVERMNPETGSWVTVNP
jgi:hypothetical protein